MEDYIYLILLIAWVLFAFYRRSQKKAEAARQASSSPQPGRQKPFTLEDIFRQEDESYGEYDTEQELKPVYQQMDKPGLRETDFEKEYKSRGITSVEELDKSIRTKPIQIIDDDHETEMASVGHIRLNIREDIRQAVIYSEILKRPYD